MPSPSVEGGIRPGPRRARCRQRRGALGAAYQCPNRRGGTIMISRREVDELRSEWSLAVDVIEKDYVLGWLLAGIAHHPALSLTWVFKGGTCLRKCYFETYRFSEDLDYTLVDESHIDKNFLIDCFKEIAIWIYDASGIEIPENTIRFEIYENNKGKVSVEGRIGYIGPLQRRNDPARIKLDL